MAEEGFKRKLAAILSADVEGYSRLMDDDEEATVRTLKTYRAAINDLVQQYRGRIVDTPGDNILVEYSSVVDAVNCAVEIQRDLAERNAELAYNRKMEFRIGVNLGDVIEDDGNIYGDGVNIAARVESLAEAGGICISGRAYDQVLNKLGLEYENLGEHQVKNISVPIRVYRVLSYPGAAAHRVVQAKKSLGRKWRNIGILIAAVVLIMAGLAFWQFYLRHPSVEPASVEKMAFPLPDKPSIAVMAFDNMSGDPEQEYFSDGLTEDIINTLSMVSELFIVSRQSTFSYKGKQVRIKQVAEELGVRYVLEGSVRKGEDRIRITAQLIDALTGHHMWAERYDRELKNIFAIQDEITKKIVTALEVKLTKGEQARVFARGTDNVEAWTLGAKAWNLCVKYSEENMAKAREHLRHALKLDPDYAFLWTVFAHVHLVSGRFGWTKSRAESYKRALECAQKAITLNGEDPFAYGYTCSIYLQQRQHEKAIAAGQRAIAIDPNFADGYVHLSESMRYSGRFEEALTLVEKGMRLCPKPRTYYQYVLVGTYLMLERYEEAIAAHKLLHERCLKGECPKYFTIADLITCYIELGREEEARTAVQKLLRFKPDYSLEYSRKINPYKNPAHTELTVNALRKMGIPEHPPLPLPDKPSIAVLAFDNLSGDPEQEYFSDGMTDELISALAKLKGLKVISRTSAFYFKDKDIDLRTIGEKLKVDHILEGSVRKDGNQLRISAQLIRVADDTHIWSETYDREYRNVFNIQEDISLAIVENLKVRLIGEKEKPIFKKFTENREAYNLYLKGRFYFNKHSPEGWRQAITCYEKALEIDPDYALAFAEIAKTQFQMAIMGNIQSRTVIPKVEETTKKALDIDKTLVEAHLTLARLKLCYKWDWEGARQDILRAIELNPDSADAHFAFTFYYTSMGRIEDALKEISKALELDPLSVMFNSWPGMLYRFLGKQDQAIDSLNKALEMFPDHPRVLPQLAFAYAEKGFHTESIEILKNLRKRIPGSPFHTGGLGYSYALAGMRDEAYQILEEALETRERGYFSPWFIATIYSNLGDKDKAFEWLNIAIEERDLKLFVIKAVPIFTDIRSDPRFDALLVKTGLKD